jgi:Raf kinase inhibitor-like YbhB/YbcL family protein
MRFLRPLPGLAVISLLTITITVAAQAPAGQAPGGRGAGGAGAAGGGPGGGAMQMTMDFQDGGQYPVKNSGLGAMLSPEIHWSNAPAATMSFVLDMNDIDFSRNRTTEGNIHWLVWNIPASAKGLPEGVPNGPLQNGAYQTSASGPGTYRAPNGPGRKHHYVFQLLALDIKLDDIMPGPDAFATRADIMKAAQGHVLSRINWVMTFGPN